jgi:TonB family protein
MKRTLAIAALALVFAALPGGYRSFAQDDATTSGRKLVSRVTPVYSELARNLNARGVVKLEVLVAPNGSVKSITVKGGHPLLVVSAQDAVRKWKWEPAPHESKEEVEVKFGAND